MEYTHEHSNGKTIEVRSHKYIEATNSTRLQWGWEGSTAGEGYTDTVYHAEGADAAERSDEVTAFLDSREYPVIED